MHICSFWKGTTPVTDFVPFRLRVYRGLLQMSLYGETNRLLWFSMVNRFFVRQLSVYCERFDCLSRLLRSYMFFFYCCQNKRLILDCVAGVCKHNAFLSHIISHWTDFLQKFSQKSHNDLLLEVKKKNNNKLKNKVKSDDIYVEWSLKLQLYSVFTILIDT